MTARFAESYDTIARFIGVPGPAAIALYRNATEAVNAVMYSLLTEFRDGDNVVTTLMEHNSNYVPWYAMCREILPRFGRRVQCRLARFDPVSGRTGPGAPGVARLPLRHAGPSRVGLNPPASCRLSFYLYNTPGEVDRAVQAVAAIAAGRGVSGSRFRSWPAVRAVTAPAASA